MKYIVIGLLLALVNFTAITGCSSTGSSGGVGLSVLGFFSWPTFFVFKNGTINFSNYNTSITGEAVTNALITVSNETTGVTTTCAYNAAALAYFSVGELKHGTSESVSLSITSLAGNVTGAATKTPNSNVVILSPLTTEETVPFTVTWLVTLETEPASHLWVIVSGTQEAYQELVPASTSSYNVTSTQIKQKGYHSVWVFPVNIMGLTGAADGSKVVVGSKGSSSFRQWTIK